MVMSVVEGRGTPEQGSILQAEYARAVTELDLGITATYLVHSISEPGLWRIVTLWSSREALEAMRNSGQPPKAPLMFRTAGMEPSHSFWEVAGSAVA